MEQKQVVYLVLYINGLLIFNKNIDEINVIKIIISTKFNMKDIKEFTFCLGIQMIRDHVKRMTSLGQAEYIGTRILK